MTSQNCQTGDLGDASGQNMDVQLFATDISTEMVAAVRRAEYPKSHHEQIPQPWRKLWTKDTRDGFAIAAEARNLVTASQLNLFDRWPWRHKFEAIFCRNVVIYFDEATQARIWGRMEPLLGPGGFLYIGHSERITGPAAARFRLTGTTTYEKKVAAS